jgi:hypothetical protein
MIFINNKLMWVLWSYIISIDDSKIISLCDSKNNPTIIEKKK